MNYLFSFNDYIDVNCLIEFDLFCWELNEIVCISTSANDNDEGAEFPPNYILVYVDTEDQSMIETISDKYHRLVAECSVIDKPKDFNKGQVQ
jgi:hypothetical protein